MNITIKESMLIRKCLGNYVSSQLLDYDKSPMFSELMYKLRSFENIKSFREGYETRCDEDSTKKSIKSLKELQKVVKNDNRKALNKELKKYDYQTICNKKVLDMIKEERSNTPKNYVKNRLTYQEWLEIHHLNKPIKTYSIDDNDNITLNNK